MGPSPQVIGEALLCTSGHKLKCLWRQVAQVAQVPRRDGGKLAHTAQAREDPRDQPTLMPWAGTVSGLPDFPCSRDNFYVKSPDLQIVVPTCLKRLYVS